MLFLDIDVVWRMGESVPVLGSEAADKLKMMIQKPSSYSTRVFKTSRLTKIERSKRRDADVV